MQHPISEHLHISIFTTICNIPPSHYLQSCISCLCSVRRVFFTYFSHCPTTHLQELMDSQIACPRPVVTCDGLLPGSTRFWHAIWIAWLALANWMGSTRPWWPAWLFGSEMPTRYAAWKESRKTAAQVLCSQMGPWGTTVPRYTCSSHA